MRDETWFEAFDHALVVAGVATADRVAARVETEGHVRDTGASAFDHFGPPDEYARSLARALGDRGAGRSAGGLGEAMVDVAGVSKGYRGRAVLSDVSLAVARGEVVALTGPNGVGKSTLLQVVAGLVPPDAGSVTLAGRVGFVPQVGGLDPYLSPGEHFELFGAAAGRTRAGARREGSRLARELGWDLDAAPVAGELSGGTAQKLAVITALLGNPEILLLDEPYQGMDARSQHRFWGLLWALQDSGCAVVVSSHSSDVLAKASKIIEIEGVTAR